jgi:cyclic pyranopterin phosphate synthase
MSENMNFLPKKDVLSLEELDRICSAFIQRGVRKLRLTGGEPLVRRNIMSLFKNLSRHLVSGQLTELTLTTNGSQLEKYASELVDYGIKRINISLDTLNADKFKRLTRWGDINKVLSGINAAKASGLAVKINTVALKNFNENEIEDLIRWCGNEGHDMTLIETMPLGDTGNDRVDQYLPLSKVRVNLEKIFTLNDINHKSGGPARYVSIKETGKMLGFITPLTHNFCEGCNRVRLTCTGTLYMCLGQNDASDLRTPLRASEGNELLNEAITEAIGRKPKGHDFVIDRAGQAPAVTRHMSVTGG